MKLSLLGSSAALALALAGSACQTNVESDAVVPGVADLQRGQQALQDAEDCADDANGAAQDCLDDLGNGVDPDENADIQSMVDQALEAIEAGRAALQDAAANGACACDLDALNNLVSGGDDDVVPIVIGCDILVSQGGAGVSADEDVCVAAAHALGDAEDLLLSLQDATDGLEQAFDTCAEAREQANAVIDAISAECAASPDSCDAASVSERIGAELDNAQAVCEAAIGGAGDAVNDLPGVNDDENGQPTDDNGQPTDDNDTGNDDEQGDDDEGTQDQDQDQNTGDEEEHDNGVPFPGQDDEGTGEEENNDFGNNDECSAAQSAAQEQVAALLEECCNGQCDEEGLQQQIEAILDEARAACENWQP